MVPNLIVAGVPKAGTTSLFRYLADHPDVCASNVKEIRFFTRHCGMIDATRMSEYGQYFPHFQGQRYRLEASPGYLSRATDIAEEMRERLPRETRLVFVLREPVSRLASVFSSTQSKVGSIRAELTFDQFVDVSLGSGDLQAIHDDPDLASRMANRVYGGVYAAPLRRFLGYWPRQQVHIDFFEHLTADPAGFMGRVCRFLDIDPAPYASYSFTTENKTRVPRLKGLHRAVHKVNRAFEKQLNSLPAARKLARSFYNSFATASQGSGTSVSPDARKRLQEFYRGPNHELQDLCRNELSIQLPDWLVSPK